VIPLAEASTSQTIPGWFPWLLSGMAGYGGLLVGVVLWLVGRFADKAHTHPELVLVTHCQARCAAEDAHFVTREKLEDQLKPIRDEQEHRKNSMATLGQALARTERRSQRLELLVTAIATKLDVEVPREVAQPDQEDP
jgi:hypothetical protein